jgi:tRNA(Ile)-lysidine synthase
VLRYGRPGDWILPFGSGHRRDLNEYLRARGVDRPFRDQIPLLCRGQAVLLACGVGAGNVPPFDPDQDNIRLTWQGDMPWRLR